VAGAGDDEGDGDDEDEDEERDDDDESSRLNTGAPPTQTTCTSTFRSPLLNSSSPRSLESSTNQPAPGTPARTGEPAEQSA